MLLVLPSPRSSGRLAMEQGVSFAPSRSEDFELSVVDAHDAKSLLDTSATVGASDESAAKKPVKPSCGVVSHEHIITTVGRRAIHWKANL